MPAWFTGKTRRTNRKCLVGSRQPFDQLLPRTAIGRASRSRLAVVVSGTQMWDGRRRWSESEVWWELL